MTKERATQLLDPIDRFWLDVVAGANWPDGGQVAIVDQLVAGLREVLETLVGDNARARTALVDVVAKYFEAKTALLLTLDKATI